MHSFVILLYSLMWQPHQQIPNVFTIYYFLGEGIIDCLLDLHVQMVSTVPWMQAIRHFTCRLILFVLILNRDVKPERNSFLSKVNENLNQYRSSLLSIIKTIQGLSKEAFCEFYEK